MPCRVRCPGAPTPLPRAPAGFPAAAGGRAPPCLDARLESEVSHRTGGLPPRPAADPVLRPGAAAEPVEAPPMHAELEGGPGRGGPRKPPAAPPRADDGVAGGTRPAERRPGLTNAP